MRRVSARLIRQVFPQPGQQPIGFRKKVKPRTGSLCQVADSQDVLPKSNVVKGHLASRGSWSLGNQRRIEHTIPHRPHHRRCEVTLSQRELGQLHNLAALQCRLVGTDADTCPVGSGDGIRPWFAILDDGADHFVSQMRV